MRFELLSLQTFGYRAGNCCPVTRLPRITIKFKLCSSHCYGRIISTGNGDGINLTGLAH